MDGDGVVEAAQQRQRGDPDVRILEVNELVGVKVQGAARGGGGRDVRPRGPAHKGLGGKFRQTALGGDAEETFHQRSADFEPEIRQAGQFAPQPVEGFVGGHEAAAQGGVAFLVQVLGLEVGHVYGARALARAGLAAQAGTEGCGEGGVLEGVVVLVAGQDLAQDVGAAAGAVGFGEQGAVGGAHRSAGRFAAVAGAVALLGGADEAALATPVQGGSVFRRRDVGLVAEALVHGRCLDDLTGVEDVLGVKGFLQLYE